MIRLFTIALFCLFINSSLSFSQCMMTEMPLSENVNSSQFIFEGKVIAKKSFWNQEQTNIFTSNTIRIYKIFKGDLSASTVDVITPGGIVFDKMEVVSPSLELNIGDVGILLTNLADVSLGTNSLAMEPLASAQGFIRYDLIDKTATDPFHKYTSIEKDVYTVITNLTSQPYRTIETFDIAVSLPNVLSPQFAPVITSFTPTSISAGTLSVLTINGTGFGTTKGKVEFRNADDGGVSYVAAPTANITSWTDNQILVMVPSKVGTGTVRVTNASSVSVVSSSTLSIPYGQLTAMDGSGIENRLKITNRNSLGGLTFQFSTNFPTAAKAAFQRALSTWRCNTYVNYSMSAVTTTTTCNNKDGVNIVSYDNNCALGTNILGLTNTYYDACSSGSNWFWTLTEADIRFASSKSWNFGPGATTNGTYDFETITLHELGHAHLMSHVNTTSDLMFWERNTNTDIRMLSSADLTNGNEIMNRSIVANSCYQPTGTSVTTKINAAACTVTVNDIPAEEIFRLYPNPSLGSFIFAFTPSVLNSNLSVIIYDELGRVVDLREPDKISYLIEENNLGAGMYFYSLFKNGELINSGRIAVVNQ